MSKPKIVSFLGDPAESIAEKFKGKTEPITVTRAGPKNEITEDESCEIVKDASVIVVFPGSPYMSKKILESAEKVRLIQVSSVGYDNIDIKAATELGIPVANIPGFNSVSVAEHTIMLILMTLRNTLKVNRKSIEGDLKLSDYMGNLPKELKDRTLGIVGLGDIGREVAKLAGAFGSNVIYYKRNRLSEELEKQFSVEYRSFEELLAESDIVSLHVPLSDETRGLIGEKEIGLMKDGAILINTAREFILDEEAVSVGLRGGKLSGVGVDTVSMRVDGGVFVFDSPLLGLDQVVFTPHMAGASVEALVRASRMWVENVCRLLNGEKPQNLVNEV
jgi:lactate dehydrogenase-like 2-hydroxyacid dehydrogenase